MKKMTLAIATLLIVLSASIVIFGKQVVTLASNGVPSDLADVVSRLDQIVGALQKLNLNVTNNVPVPNVTVNNQVPVPSVNVNVEPSGDGSNPSNYSMFLWIDGIHGGSQDPDHRDWIDALSYSCGAFMPTSAMGTPSGRPMPDPFNITKLADKTTPIIAFSVDDGTRIREVDLEIDDNQGGFSMKYKLEDVLIISDKQNGNAFGQTQPFEEISFDYMKITWIYKLPGQAAVTRSFDYSERPAV
jgi:type VI secretion system Hcp family effector